MSPEAVAYIGIGSNIRPEENVFKALELLAGTYGIRLTGISTFYRTAALSDPEKPYGSPHEKTEDPDPDFLNGVLEIRTFCSPQELLERFSAIEQSLGRKRPSNRFAPRTMDLDLLLYRDSRSPSIDPPWGPVNAQGDLAHPDIGNRAFVAHPLLELTPDLLLPPHNTPLRAFVVSFDTPGGAPELGFTEALRTRFLSL